MPRSISLQTVAALACSAFALTPLAACSFGGGEGDGDDDCELAFQELCSLPLTGDKSYTAPMTLLDTSADASCTAIIPANATTGAPELCVVSGATVSIKAGSTLRAIGRRPLVLMAETVLEISGTLDVSSTRARVLPETPANEVLGAGAESVACTAFPRAPTSNVEGGAGGAGGSFVALGGAGGAADDDGLIQAGGTANPQVDKSAIRFLRGGCRGQKGGGTEGGNGGPGGGVVHLLSKMSVQIFGSAKIGASGGGGMGGTMKDGGGGGGSGGLVFIDSPRLIHLGLLAANGGGGGEGGYLLDPAITNGDPGTDGAIALTPARGGNAAVPTGNGGDGGATTYDLVSAMNGIGSAYGAGGGGGSVGWIHVTAATMITGTTGTASPSRD